MEIHMIWKLQGIPFSGYCLWNIPIDVPNSHWLVDENRGVSEEKPLKNNRFL
jgi:hypothetical protein